MSNLLINRTRLKLATTSSATKVELNSGDAIGYTRARSANPAPVRGVSASTLNKFQQRGFTASCPSDSVHDPIFRSMPHRVWFDALDRGAGSGRSVESGQATCQLVLNFPSGANCSWGITMQVDGDVSSANAPASQAALTYAETYQESEIEFYFGGTSFLADLTDAAQGGSLTLNAPPIVTQRRDGTGVQNTSADVSMKGLQASLSVLFTDEATDEAAKLVTNREGIFVMRRTDASWAYAFPAVVADVPMTASGDAAAVAGIEFMQASSSLLPVCAAPASSGSALGTGEVAYIVDPTGDDITTATSGTPTVPSGGFVVAGSTLKV